MTVGRGAKSLSILTGAEEKAALHEKVMVNLERQQADTKRQGKVLSIR